MHTILLTCGRGTYSLTLARAFHAAGHRVLVADAWPRSLCRLSAAVDRYFHVPSPARATAEWIPAIRQIVRRERVDLIVPVYEEVFYLAKASVGSSDPLPLFAPDFATLIALHDKWQFIQKSASLGLSVPDTVLLTSREDLVREYARDGKNRVFKPIYSRFAAHTVARPQNLEAIENAEPTLRRPWVSQAFLSGKPYATFSIAHQGRLTAHATYATDFNHDLGPTVVYRRADRPAIVEWVRRLVAATKFTGQIGLDFIEDASGNPAAIECNPRLTGGFYLLKDNPKAAAAYFEPGVELIEASRNRSYAFRFWLFFTLFRHTKAFPGFREWARQVASARSTNAFTLSDPVPRLLGPVLATEFLLRCYREGKSFREMVTRDFEWSEDPDAAQAGRLVA
jgi:ATP-grasp domain